MVNNDKLRHTGVGVQIEAPSPVPGKIRIDCDMTLNLPTPLTIEEKKYLLAVERGDLGNVRRMLQKAHRRHDININCMDPLGRRALTLAIDAENLEMVELLVIMGVDTKDALLQAINAEFVEAVELLLEHEELIHVEGEPYSWQKVDINTAMFTPDITPLILAAHRNNYEILKILLDRGAALPIPHDIRCGCDDCIRSSSEDSLRYSLSRVNVFKALASPSLIALSSSDPLLTAFQLSWELRNLAFTEQECKHEYLELRRQCQRFAVDLLDQTRSSQELAIVLNYDPDSPPYEDGDYMSLARLVLAIQYKQKKFVAHSNIQQLLASIWYEGVPGFRRKSNLQKCLNIVRVAVLFPLYCLTYMIAPNCKIGKLMRKPFMKFLIHASSYLFFLFILILVSQRSEDDVIRILGSDNMKRNLMERESRQRGNGPMALEIVVVLYVIGFIWEEVQEIYTVGMRNYLRNLWNFIDFTRNTLYISVICLRTLAYITQSKEILISPQSAFVPRQHWDEYDPQMISEGLFAAANVFSALKLIHLFSINPHLGPLQISLGRMVIDIVKFFFIYSLVLFAFACGLNQLLWYFADLEKQKCHSLPGGEADWGGNGDACMKWRRFANLFESSQSLFWASFGMIDLDTFELEGIKSYTRFWGLLMFGSYSVINVIVLLNLLIAMMSNSYAMIDEHSDTEWKFARTKLWMSYFDDSATLPPPFNVLPSVKWIIRCFRKSKKDLKREATMKKRETERENRYTNIMRSLVWRYVSAMHRRCEESPVSEDDINEVKNDISTMRYEFLEIFERNGMDTSSAAKREKPVRARKTKIWERRLMKDFQVAPITGDEDVVEKPEVERPENEDPKARFRRIARQVANESIAHKWNEVLSSVTKNSQIGRCCNRQSFKNQQNLQRAIQEAKRLVLQSPPPRSGNMSPIELVDTTSSTLLELLKEISEEVGLDASTSTLNVPHGSRSRSRSPVALLAQKYHQKLSENAKATQQSQSGVSDKKQQQKSTNRQQQQLQNQRKSNGQQQSTPSVHSQPPAPPSIKVTSSDNRVVLTPSTMMVNKLPPPKGKKLAPQAPAPGASVPVPPPPIPGFQKQNQSAKPSNCVKKDDSIADPYDPQIQFLSLNDSTERLVPRGSSPDSACPTPSRASPRLGGDKRKGWL